MTSIVLDYCKTAYLPIQLIVTKRQKFVNERRSLMAALWIVDNLIMIQKSQIFAMQLLFNFAFVLPYFGRLLIWLLFSVFETLFLLTRHVVFALRCGQKRNNIVLLSLESNCNYTFKINYGKISSQLYWINTCSSRSYIQWYNFWYF